MQNDNEVPDFIAIAHPINPEGWKPYITNFHELMDRSATIFESFKTFGSITDEILTGTTEIDLETWMDYPATWVNSIIYRIFVHLYCSPDNKGIAWLDEKGSQTYRELKGTELYTEIRRLDTSLCRDEEFLALYRHCELHKIDVSSQVKRIRNRLTHTRNKKGQLSERPTSAQIKEANLRLRRTIHTQDQAIISPVVINDQMTQLKCVTCEPPEDPNND